MRRNNGMKTIFLGILIIICIIQTAMLWLGDFPSQNFFKPKIEEKKGIDPFAIWVIRPSASNTGKPSSLAYKMDYTIENSRREYESLVLKLQILLHSSRINAEAVKVESGIQWDKLLTMPAIVYDYEVPLTIGQISGSGEDYPEIGLIDMVFVHSDTKFEKNISISFVSKMEEKVYTLQIPEGFKEFTKVYQFYAQEEVVQGITTYQPSALSNVKEYIKGNVFMPIASMKNPIFYEVINVYNPISLVAENGMKELEKYVNGFFINPLLKDTTYNSDGTVIFKEPTKNVVMYSPKGVIEYINLAPKSNNITTTLVSGYNVAMDFIEETEALTEVTKEGLYLANIEEKQQEITYYFDMLYDGYKVVLGQKVREYLEIDSLVKITVRNNQVISCSICTLQFEPEMVGGQVREWMLKSEYVDPINEALEVLLKQGKEPIQFDEMETVYHVNDVKENVYLTRGILLDRTWYYP